MKSCTQLAVQADGAAITTIEGLVAEGTSHAVKESFHRKHGLQCGFYTPGMILTTVAFLKGHPNPTVDEMRHGLKGILCHCTGCVDVPSC